MTRFLTQLCCVRLLGAAALLGAALCSQPVVSAMIVVDDEATIRGGTQSAVNQDEAAAGYVFAKYDTNINNIRKAYFQFDLSGANADLSSGATFSFFLQRDFAQAIYVWVLDQAYPTFDSSVTWDIAQANDTAGNDMLTAGVFTATQIGSVIAVPGAAVGEEVQVNVPLLSGFVFSDLITFAVTGADSAGTGVTNNSGGLRIERGTAQLEVSTFPEPAAIYAVASLGLAVACRPRRDLAVR